MELNIYKKWNINTIKYIQSEIHIEYNIKAVKYI